MAQQEQQILKAKRSSYELKIYKKTEKYLSINNDYCSSNFFVRFIGRKTFLNKTGNWQ